ncbi:MAG: VWA domain-containing protein [Clostridia bacterium]|nr:VWA domain-containing protein [Clostridia bacterium]
MKNTKKRVNKILSIILALTIVVSTFAGLSLVSAAGNPNFNKVADNATLDGWKEFFGTSTASTKNAGGVWTDKSVFVDNNHEVFQNLTDAYGNSIKPTVSDDSFLVALSAIASNKSIVGYSHIPTDTILVLDVSSSMGPGNQSHNNDAIAELVAAANSAMTELLAINKNNRIGVVLYWGSTTTFLPIDRYTTTNKVTGTDTLKFFETNSSRNQVTISSGVKDGQGKSVQAKTQKVQSGTYIQGGLGLAADMFKAKSDANDTIISGDGFQAGTQRKPVVVLMTDGAPSYGTTAYADPGNSTLGLNATSSNNFAFLTQLTAAAVKKDITGYYNGSETMFYTLGFKIGSDATARSVVDPRNSTSTITNFWNTYKAASVGSNVTIRDGNQTVTIKKSGKVDDIVYNDAYYSADSNDDLEAAFNKMINEIIIQSLYRPTLVENNNANMEGFIEFIDDIGDYMKVQEIEGIMVGDKLFTGEKLSENFRTDGGDLGTVDNPNDMGNVLVSAVRERLQIDSIAEARELITNAYTHGQLSYSKQGSKVTFSNYIGWYADENGKYLGFWCDKHTYKDVPNGAKYINKSYGMLGEISDKYTESDLMYTSIQVHTEIVPQDRFNSKDTDNVVAGHAQLIFRVPAALIPVVTYDVELEGTGYEDAKNITMNISDAEPIRLLFEVGLRDDVNEYNIEAALGNNHRNANGEYVFYTNQWSVEQFDTIIDPNNSEYIAPTESINTIAYFEPNYENERYYYNELTPIYVKQGSSYVKYSSATKPTANDGNEYYRQINSFELTGNGNEAVLKKSYERISNAAIARIEKSDTNNGWNIIKETVHRVYDEIQTPKNSNLTNTIGYSYYPTVEHIEGTHYYADAILGNNGVLTVTPATGISITKTVDASLEGNTDEYTFNVKIGDDAARYSVIRKDDKGMFADFGEKIELDSEGNGTIKLVPGETVLIVGIPAGVSYTVSEDVPSGANYEVSKSSGTLGVIEQYHLSAAKFENAIRQSGNLIISKRVAHPFGTTPDSIYNHVFKFDATLSASGAIYPDATVSAYYSTAPDAKFDLNVVNNKIEGIELKGNQSIIIKIKDGWTTNVTEQSNMPSGFTLTDTNVSTNKTVTVDTNVEYVFTNTYAPKSVNADVVIDASKVLNGRPWNNDEFTFALYRYNKSAAQYEEIGRETVNKSGDFGASLTNAIKSEVFTEVGEYHYMVRELVPNETKGVTYDSNYRIFTVVVTDNDTDGKLEIAEVEAENAVSVAANGNAYIVVANDFVNVYKAEGIAEVTIEINKMVNTPSGITYSPEGFEFGVYDNTGKLITPIHETDANGKTQFTFTYDATGVDYQNNKVYNYVIKENNTGLGGITYADDIPFTVTIKDNLDGTISATTNIANKNGDVSIVDVINVYSTKDISVSIEATKKLNGRELVAGEFEFALSDSNGNVIANATNDANGRVVFESLTFDKVGTYNYVVYENETDGKGVTVDTTKYAVQVVVTDNSVGNLIATVKVNGTVVNGSTASAIVFENSYKAAKTDIVVLAQKVLEGRTLCDGEFEFELYYGDTLIATAKNDVDGNVKFENIVVEDAGEYEFTVKEVKGNDENVAYDETVYTVTVTVTDNLDGTLSLDYVYANGEEEVEEIVFNNKYIEPTPDPEPMPDPEPTPEPKPQPEPTPQPESPKTGDGVNLAGWLAVMFSSGAILFATGKKLKKVKNS